ncbi:MAG: hypothetical protein WC881_09165 [Elusimicrobiota bacterium]|jgi:hypothetical protein
MKSSVYLLGLVISLPQVVLGAGIPAERAQVMNAKMSAVALAFGAGDVALPMAPASLDGVAVEQPLPEFRFDQDSLYRRGALVADVSGPEDKFYRRISMKLITVRGEARPESGYERLVNMLAICDITNASDIYCHRFNIGSALDVTFPMDDRSDNYLWYKHVLRIWFSEEDTRISFGRPGHEDRISTTVRHLTRLRAQQVVDEGFEMYVGEVRFLVLGQGTPKGTLLFFPGDLQARMEVDNLALLKPTLLAEVSVRSSDGYNELVGGHIPLGWVKNQYYYLLREEPSGRFIPVPGNPPIN